MKQSTLPPARELGLRRQFRFFSRAVYQSPSLYQFHQKRLRAGAGLGRQEPLQGALADLFFACWYDMAVMGPEIMSEYGEKLPAHIQDEFWRYVNTGEHLPKVSPLATRFSVLVSPSMQVPAHQIYLGRDDAKSIAKQITQTLVLARQTNDDGLVAETTQAYLAHCMACKDLMGFMMTWFALSKESWVFDKDWQTCKFQLEQLQTIKH